MKKLLTAALLLLLLPAWAHRVDLFLAEENGSLVVWAFYPDGTPAKGAKVRILTPEGKLLLEGTTDREGKFTFSPPADAGLLKVELYAGLGHKAETTYSLKEERARPSAGVLNQTAAARPRPAGPDWQKVFCGLGWIFGLFGILSLVYGRRKGAA
ncbi:MAG: hypothetical protein GXO08_01615 [Aquificae bacterium]|nr:hypothetical protein [Aquificota bacterium]